MLTSITSPTVRDRRRSSGAAGLLHRHQGDPPGAAAATSCGAVRTDRHSHPEAQQGWPAADETAGAEQPQA